MTRQLFRSLPWRTACGHGLWIGLAAFLVASCDKMPLLAPTGTTITLSAGSTTSGLNASIEITATVIESAGTAVQNGTVVSFTTTLGTIDPPEAPTNNGKATVRLLSGSQSGTAEVRAFSGGATSGDTAMKIAIGAAAAGKVDLLANPSALPASGGIVQLTAMVNDSSGNRLAGVSVSFTTDAGLLSQASATSDGNGEARTSLTTTAKAKVTASIVGGSGSGGALTATVDIPVRVGPIVAISAPVAGLVPGVAASFGVTVTAGGAAVRTATIDFGDGGSQSVATAGTSTVAHVYSRSGTFVVIAAATDTAGETTTAMASVSVQAVIVAVTLNVPAAVTTTAPAEFSATASVPAGVTVERYEWDFGDGSTATTSGSSTNHLYTVGGKTYTVKVRAVTTTGASGTAQKEITVSAAAGPTAAFTFLPAAPLPGQAVIFNGSGSSSQLPITGYAWEFGDSSTGTGVSPTHTYAAAGTFVVRLTVTDSSGRTAIATNPVTVTASAITAKFTSSPTSPTSGDRVFFNGSESTGQGGIVSYAWDFGDGTLGVGVTTDRVFPCTGVATSRIFTVRLTVQDALGATATTTRDVMVTKCGA